MKTSTITGAFQVAQFASRFDDRLLVAQVSFTGQLELGDKPTPQIQAVWVSEIEKIILSQVVRGEVITTERAPRSPEEVVELTRLLEAQRVISPAFDRALDEMAETHLLQRYAIMNDPTNE